MSLLVVGSVALDSVKTPFGEIKEGLGGSATYFSIAAGCFTKVRLVAVVGEDFPEICVVDQELIAHFASTTPKRVECILDGDKQCKYLIVEKVDEV